MYLDLHIHPTLKPYGKSYGKPRKPADSTSETSLWYQKHITDFNRLIESVLGFVPYPQSSLKDLKDGNVKLAVVSLYPQEVGFVKNKLQHLNNSEELVNLIAAFGENRINTLASPVFDYYKDLEDEYAYLKLLNGVSNPQLPGKYILVENGQHLDNLLKNSEEKGTILLINSIEGAHVFTHGNQPLNPNNKHQILQLIDQVKNWQHRPFFITLAHHFYNGVCSHAESFDGPVAKFLDQSYCLNNLHPSQGLGHITTIGKDLIRKLLDNDQNNRILIDVKHMSLGARMEFYQMMAEEYSNQVPIIFSHGGVMGENSNRFHFYNKDINLTNGDIISIAKSGGLIGLEYDQRIMGMNEPGFKSRLGRTIGSVFKNKAAKQLLWAEPVFENMLHVALVCQQNNLPAWDCLAIGSDYDGIINPLNQYRVARTFPDMAGSITILLDQYLKGPGQTLGSQYGLNAQQIVEKVFFSNAKDFIIKHF